MSTNEYKFVLATSGTEGINNSYELHLFVLIRGIRGKKNPP